MRLALPGSALIHAGALALVLVGFSWEHSDDAPAPAPVSVSIVSVSSVSANDSEVLEADATVSSVSSGADVPVLEPLEAETIEEIIDAVEPIVPETVVEQLAEPLELVETDTLEPETSAPVETETPQETVEPEETALDEAEPVETLVAEAPLAAELTTSDVEAPLAALAPQSVAAEIVEAIEPVEVAELNTAPVPVTASFTRQSEPIVHKPRPQQTPPSQQQQTPRPQPQGNGGNANADSVAAAGAPAAQPSFNGAGGAAAEARYQSQVTRKVRNELRSLRGQSGLVVIGFTIHANGQVSGVRVATSSGNAAIDQAGIDAVNRAAPFPPFPGEVNRSTWPFGVPLEYRR